jgi:thiamine pyrophosphate-dependent acetolactate synthase large subunit-like protein
VNQRDAFRTLAEYVGDELVVTGIGSQTQLWHSILHRPGNFYLSGPMGQAIPFGLGLALARPKERVIAVEGDGSLLMNLGALASAAQHQPENLLILLMDNECYDLTGAQPMVNRGKTDFGQMARALGIEETHEAAEETGLGRAIRSAKERGRFAFLWARLKPLGEKPPPFPHLPYEIKYNFWQHVRGGGPSQGEAGRSFPR